MKSDEDPPGPEKLARIFKPLKKNPRLIGTKESVTVEYKLIFEKKKIWKYAKTICAFAIDWAVIWFSESKISRTNWSAWTMSH